MPSFEQSIRGPKQRHTKSLSSHHSENPVSSKGMVFFVIKGYGLMTTQMYNLI